MALGMCGKQEDAWSNGQGVWWLQREKQAAINVLVAGDYPVEFTTLCSTGDCLALAEPKQRWNSEQ